MSANEMPARIWLIPNAGNDGETLWCDNPAPGVGMDETEAVEYRRADIISLEAPYRVSLLEDMTDDDFLADVEGCVDAGNEVNDVDLDPFDALQAQETEAISPETLIDLIGELGREVYYLLDDCETSGPVGAEVHTITEEGLTTVSDILDRIDALPFDEPGVILGTGAMLQTALKQTFIPNERKAPPQPSVSVAEAANVLLDNIQETWRAFGNAGIINAAKIDAALRALKRSGKE